MRAFLLVIGLLGLRASAGTPAADLRGTARAGDRPQPNAVVQRDRTAFDFAVTYSFRRDIDTGRP